MRSGVNKPKFSHTRAEVARVVRDLPCFRHLQSHARLVAVIMEVLPSVTPGITENAKLHVDLSDALNRLAARHGVVCSVCGVLIAATEYSNGQVRHWNWCTSTFGYLEGARCRKVRLEFPTLCRQHGASWRTHMRRAQREIDRRNDHAPRRHRICLSEQDWRLIEIGWLVRCVKQAADGGPYHG